MNPGLPQKVILAGYNVDSEILQRFKSVSMKNGLDISPDSITPETISAAYARISRNPAEIPLLRRSAREEVADARKSNKAIIFGLGHSSVAEHAVFNLDILGVSRLAVEFIESHRLVSYTEKSQRYIKLDGDYVLPPELKGTSLETRFHELIDEQNKAYHQLYSLLENYFFEYFSGDGEPRPRSRARGAAGEDARYVLSLATQAQIGMTINARSLEQMIRSSLANPLAEMKTFGANLRDAVHGLAPSLVKYVDVTESDSAVVSDTLAWSEDQSGNDEAVTLLGATPRGEEKVMTALVMRAEGVGWMEASRRVENDSPRKRRELVFRSLRNLRACDSPPREFELMDFYFELLLSASAFAQFKRHRMATMLAQSYGSGHGWTIPDSVLQVNGEEQYRRIMQQSLDFAGELAKVHPWIAPYGLTNGHRRRVLFKANARELYHFARLREDLHAQWDIRHLAKRIMEQAKSVAPDLLALACGKHQFDDVKRKMLEQDG